MRADSWRISANLYALVAPSFVVNVKLFLTKASFFWPIHNLPLHRFGGTRDKERRLSRRHHHYFDMSFGRSLVLCLTFWLGRGAATPLIGAPSNNLLPRGPVTPPSPYCAAVPQNHASCPSGAHVVCCSINDLESRPHVLSRSLFRVDDCWWLRFPVLSRWTWVLGSLSQKHFRSNPWF